MAHSKCYHLLDHPCYILGVGVALTNPQGMLRGGFQQLVPFGTHPEPQPWLSVTYQLDQAFKCSLDYFCITPRELVELLFLVLWYDLLGLPVSHIGTEVPRC